MSRVIRMSRKTRMTQAMKIGMQDDVKSITKVRF